MNCQHEQGINFIVDALRQYKVMFSGPTGHPTEIGLEPMKFCPWCKEEIVWKK